MNTHKQRSFISSVIHEKIGFSYILFSIIIMTTFVLHSHNLLASSSTSTVYSIDVTNCIKCYSCQRVAYHSIEIDDDEFPFFINGSIYSNYRILVNPPQEYLEDLDEAIAGCPMECISKSIHQKRK
jgi:ferredoxin